MTVLVFERLRGNFGLAKGDNFYFQPFLSCGVDDVFELFGNTVVNPVRSALVAHRGRNLANHDNSKI